VRPAGEHDLEILHRCHNENGTAVSAVPEH